MLVVLGDNTQSTVTSAFHLLIDLLLTNEPFPVQSYGEARLVFSEDGLNCLFRATLQLCISEKYLRIDRETWRRRGIRFDVDQVYFILEFTF